MKILNKIFSITNSNNHKIITILGIKIKFIKKTKKMQVYIQQQLYINKVKQQKMFSVYELHKKTFPKFKNIHLNKNIAIVGCGPTLNYYSPIDEKLIHIGLNRALSCEKINFQYHFCIDAQDDMRDWLEKFSKYDCIKFYGEHLNFMPEIREDRGCSYIPENDLIRDGAIRFYSNLFEKEIYHDISTAPLMDFGSIAFCALHFALYTNPQKIYLIGIDSSNNGYFHKSKRVQTLDFLEMNFEGYKLLKKFASVYYPQTEIISINPVGLKGFFKDVYTQNYINEHLELLNEDITILEKEATND